MSLKYYEAAKGMRKSTPKEYYYEDYNAIVDLTFDNAPNVAYREIFFEREYGSNKFELLEKVRVDTILDYNTGIILSDDYKTFIFPSDLNIKPLYGMKFKWNDDYWLVVNTNNLESMVTSAEVRRCNNVLRFYNNDGVKIYEPCIMDYVLRFTKNKDTNEIVYGGGEQKIWCQRNDNTVLIQPNDRFLFGTPEQRVAYRVYGGGIKNYLNGTTTDEKSPTLTEIYIQNYQINPLLDDLENGFANAYFNDLRIEILTDINKIKKNEEVSIEAVLYKGDNIVEQNLVYNVDNTDILDFKDNILTAKNIGSANIYISLEDDDRIYSSMRIEVVEEIIGDKYQILINPEDLYVLQGETKEFSLSLYNNGILVDDEITILNSTTDVPVDNYEIINVDNNKFSILNKHMYMQKPLIIECIYKDFSKKFEIYLRGVY